MRRGVLAGNPQATSFDILRAGDDITLILSVHHGGERIDFRLLGDKHDYYRLSMGVRIEETLRVLAQADPNLETAGAERQGELVTLRFFYSGATASPPSPALPSAEFPQTRPPSPPLPASAPFADTRAPTGTEPPPGAQEEVATSPAGAFPMGPTRVTESAAASVPAPEDVPVQQAPGSGEAYRQALREDTLPAWSRFLDRYPNAPETEEARRRAATLREQAAYQTALDRNDAAGYRAFLEHFPDTDRRTEMEARLRVTEEARRRDVAGRQAAEASERRRQEAYSEARRLDTAESYRIFLTVYPKAPEAAEARRRLNQVVEDDHDFEKARASLRGLESYLADRPKGRHADDARRLLREKRTAQEEGEFKSAQAAGTEAAWEGYLARWPRGRRAREATQALAALRTPPPATRSEKPIGPVLRAPRVEKPPLVDGSDRDKAWRDAEALELALSGGPGPSSLRVRALHDGKSLYLLAEWADSSRDEIYRPWVWDTGRQTYYQNEQLDDALAVAFYRKAPANACMLQGSDLDADSWLWRAFWSSLSGLADDGRLRVSRDRTPQSNPYPVSGGRSGQVWVREESDDGRSAWSFFIPVDYQGDTVPSYQVQQATASRGDVQSRGLWSKETGTGTWTVEFARRLDTGHADDVSLAEGKPQAIAFAVFDKGDKGRHASSQLVQLELRGR